MQLRIYQQDVMKKLKNNFANWKNLGLWKVEGIEEM